LIYTVAAGNTPPVGLANGFSYYAVYANSTGTALSTIFNGANLAITPSSVSETGHTLTFNIPSQNGHTLSFTPHAISLTLVNGAFTNTYQVKGNTSHSNAYLSSVGFDNTGLTYLYSVNTAQTAFVNNFAINEYVRVGSNTSLNIRRVLSINSSCMVVDSKFAGQALGAPYYLVTSATEVTLFYSLMDM